MPRPPINRCCPCLSASRLSSLDPTQASSSLSVVNSNEHSSHWQSARERDRANARSREIANINFIIHFPSQTSFPLSLSFPLLPLSSLTRVCTNLAATQSAQRLQRERETPIPSFKYPALCVRQSGGMRGVSLSLSLSRSLRSSVSKEIFN